MSGRGRGRGRGARGGANRGRNHNPAPPPNWNDLGAFNNSSSDSDEDVHFINGLALIEALQSMRGSLSGKSHFGKGPDPSGSEERIFHTEDGFPVNTIYASFTQNPESITEAVVRKMFEQFGLVKSVRIHTNQNNNKCDDEGNVASGGRPSGRGGYRRNMRNDRIIRYGFISYERCEDAAKCLQKKCILKNRCFVAAADSWHQEAYRKKLKESEQGGSQPKDTDAAGSSGTGTAEGASVPPKAATEADLNSSVKAESVHSTIDADPEGITLLDLNDDCLLMICDYLELMDLLSLKKTCSRMENITAETFKRYKILDFDIDPMDKKYLTLLDAKNILTEIGSYIEHLFISRDRFLKPSVRILNMIHHYCPNLKHLDINDFTVKPKAVKGFDEVFKSLEGLSLVACSIEDTIGQNLKLATKLERLDISENSEVTGKCLKFVNKQLKHLNLEGCQNIQGKPFTTFASTHKSLEYLNIACCSRLTSEAIKAIASSMTELKHMVCNNNYEGVDQASMALLAKMPSLRKVQFKMNSYNSIDHMLEGFAEINQLEHLDMSDGIFTSIDYSVLSRLTNLKELKLNYKLDFSNEHLQMLCGTGRFVELHVAGCTKITDKQLIEFIRKNPQLKLLDISYCQITEGLIFSAIDILKEQSVGCRVGGRQLKMLVGQTSICQVILKNTLVEANRHLLNISFDCTEGFYGGMEADDMYDDIMDDDDEDFMGYDYDDDDDDEVMWGLDHDLDFEEMCHYVYDSDDDDYKYVYYK